MRPMRLPAGSVRLRLTLWNVSVFAFVLLALAAASHLILERTLLNALDQEMSARAAEMVRSLEQAPAAETERAARWGAERALRASRSATASRRVPWGRRRRGNGPMARFFRPKAMTLDRRDYIRLVPEPPWDEAAFALAARGETLRSSLVLTEIPARVHSLPIRHHGRVDGVVQVARPLSDVEDALWASSRTLLLLAPLALLICGVVGAFLTSRALQPVRTLRDAADRIQAEKLSRRLPVPGGDEFSDLARTFNEMLGRLEHAFRQQTRFTADASHELRTPLTVLRGNLSLALARPRSPEEYRDTIQRAYRVTERMSRLVEDLLLLARADAGQLVLETEPAPLPQILSAAVAVLPHRHVALTGHAAAADAPLMVRGNPGLLTTLFVNLLKNAARHTPDTGTLAIHAVRQGDAVAVTVEDTGEGIPPEHLPNLLDRFYRVDDSRSSESGGIGLGLAICQSIANAHGGALAIRSEVGKGTAVTVTLPLV